MQKHNTEAQRLRGTEEQELNAKAQRGTGTEKIRRIVVRVGLTAVLLIVALVIVPRVRGFTLGDAEAFIGAPLPADAQNVQFVTRDQFTRLVWIRFTLPPDADITPFVQAMALSPDMREGFTPFPEQNYTEADMAWWTPYAAQDFSGLYAIHNTKVYELLLDKTDSAALTVYLRVYGI